MKLSSLKLVLASLALTTFALSAGCSSDPAATENDDDHEDVGVSEAEISALAAQFVGEYEWKATQSGSFVDFRKVNFKSNGTYTAQVDSGLVNPNVVCFAFPCTLGESGTWQAYRSFGRVKIRVNPYGWKPTRSYFASASWFEGSIKLQRFGQTTKLFKVSNITCANVRCASGTHCEMQNGSPACVPNLTCASVLCAPNTHCEMQNGSPTCVPNLTCATVLCAPNTTCQMQNGEPVCVPILGCESVLCMEGTTCAMVNGAPVCQPNCKKTGCSGHICAEQDMITTCEWQPDYACYQQAECKRQANGQCGFTQTAALQACLANN